MNFNEVVITIKSDIQKFKIMVNNCPVMDWDNNLQKIVNNKVP